MRLDTQLFILSVVLILASCAMFYFGFNIAGVILMASAIAGLGLYVYHMLFLHENSKQEMSLKQYEIYKYWEIVEKNPDVINERDKRAGFGL